MDTRFCLPSPDVYDAVVLGSCADERGVVFRIIATY
jgi:hypothetical protein